MWSPDRPNPQPHSQKERGTLDHGPQIGSLAEARDLYTNENTYRYTRLPVERALTLNPNAYRTPEFFAVELEQVWARGWVCVGYTAQVAQPGDMLVTSIGDQPLFVTRNKQGALRAFYNVCRHRGSQLLSENCNHEVIRCPYHCWGYSLDGELLGAPYFKGLDVPPEEQALYDTSEVQEFRKEDYPLLPVRVDHWGCFVFVNLSEDAPPLREWLGDLPERFAHFPLDELQLVRRREIPINANWKLIAENFMEYYHLPWVHPELCNVSGFKDHYRYQGPGMYTGMCTSPLTYDPNTVRLDLPNMPGLNPTESRSAYWVWMFPNVAWFLLPNHLFTLLVRPDTHGRTLECADMLVHPSALQQPDAQQRIDAVFAFWDMVNSQDIGAVERVQRGLTARAYKGGRMCFRFEEPVHRFQNMVIDRMVGRQRVPEGDATEEAPVLAAATGNE